MHTGSELEVRKMMLAAALPMLRRLKAHGKSKRRTRNCGARGKVVFQDSWKWPKKGQYLFPNRYLNGRLKKDAVCHAIASVRKTFVAPKGCSAMFEPNRVRSHSGRHRMINDLKLSGISADAAMTYARIKDKKTFDKYGQLDQEQSGKVLNRNSGLKRTLKDMYS